ncbi:heavy-metal-associated domain-containing protein [Acrocarpospora macrocephala]|uniref:HMA domain-containing protein n=1 Tax=Acrocarpospora macrocephala TaxID=150177 RepID=A0A5M3WZ58_9ACTN|nr:heavy metal-associated domain-containing protein [Acrocarpospora macrocephala]GES14254.1 hypothetical protein Amac_078510 [Acrocarpospora macrocephala]
MTTSTFTVSGMTCGHCVSSVREEVSGIPGVTTVEVDLPTGLLTVTADVPVDSEAVSRAVKEAGYAMTGSS